MANSEVITREDLKNVFGALGEGSYGTRIDALEENVSVIGTFYTGATVATSAATGTTTVLSRMTLPVGTYIIEGSFQWQNSVNSMSYMQLSGLPNSTPIVRSSPASNNSGGGINICAVRRFDTEATINLNVYQASGSTQPVNRLQFNAVRIA